MSSSAKLGFELKTAVISVDSIVPRAQITQEIRKSRKYKQIASSIEHVGLVEPLVVCPLPNDQYLLLDGALRLDILKRRNDREVRCILSTDDEGYTYNKRVNHLSNIGEHYMILKALGNGVSEQDISVSLSVDVETIRRKRSMLEGICPEAIALLTNRRVAVYTYSVLRKMKPLGQIQAAERMITANNYSTRMAKALLTITKSELLLNPEKPSRSSPGTTAKLELLQSEAETLLADLKKVEDSYATQALDLTLALGYIERLISNKNVQRYLEKHHAELLSEFKKQIKEKADQMSRASTSQDSDLSQIARASRGETGETVSRLESSGR
jgi:hypothetical protein